VLLSATAAYLEPNEAAYLEEYLTIFAKRPNVLGLPYMIAVPTRAAHTREQLTEYSAHWPVNYVPIRVGASAEIQPKGWNRSHLDWVRTMVNRVQRLARESADNTGDLPIASIVASSVLGPPLAEASDTRLSSGNILCHSIANVIDSVASLDLNHARRVENEPPPYLLSGLSLFTTHEPCMMCSMALLHSRIAVVYYVHQSPLAGGLGSIYSVHEDKGLNHKFEAWHWKGETDLGTDWEVNVDP